MRGGKRECNGRGSALEEGVRWKRECYGRGSALEEGVHWKRESYGRGSATEEGVLWRMQSRPLLPLLLTSCLDFTLVGPPSSTLRESAVSADAPLSAPSMRPSPHRPPLLAVLPSRSLSDHAPPLLTSDTYPSMPRPSPPASFALAVPLTGSSPISSSALQASDAAAGPSCLANMPEKSPESAHVTCGHAVSPMSLYRSRNSARGPEQPVGIPSLVGYHGSMAPFLSGKLIASQSTG